MSFLESTRKTKWRHKTAEILPNTNTRSQIPHVLTAPEVVLVPGKSTWELKWHQQPAPRSHLPIWFGWRPSDCFLAFSEILSQAVSVSQDAGLRTTADNTLNSAQVFISLPRGIWSSAGNLIDENCYRMKSFQRIVSLQNATVFPTLQCIVSLCLSLCVRICAPHWFCVCVCLCV